uniref:F-box domain-containing protein n=1 Tax=Kalanchoe fedtschenkoi TaxID=63787 RepID=A0A7N0U5A5_KALFE
MAAKRTTFSILDFPSDLLLLILNRLDQNDLRSISLASKSFRPLTNQIVRKLTFSKPLPTDRAFRKIFTQFFSVDEITIHSTRVGRTLEAISSSRLDLKTLRIQGCPSSLKQNHVLSLRGRFEKLKALNLRWFANAGVDQIIEFIQLFPALEELDFSSSGQWNDVGIERLTLEVPNLRKINLAGNMGLTDRSLNALAVNCANLEYVNFKRCGNLTLQCFCTFLSKRQNLRSLDLPTFFTSPQTLFLSLAESISSCKNLGHFSTNRRMIGDEFLSVIAKSPSSLTSFTINPGGGGCIYYTMEGLSTVLCAFPCLTRLVVCLPSYWYSSQDAQMSELVKSLPDLTDITVTSYRPINETLLSLIENCPVLKYITLRSDTGYITSHCVAPPPTRKNYSIERISLYPEPDTLLKTTLEWLCPSLKKITFLDFYKNNF